jgi:hypothetical protein
MEHPTRRRTDLPWPLVATAYRVTIRAFRERSTRPEFEVEVVRTGTGTPLSTVARGHTPAQALAKAAGILAEIEAQEEAKGAKWE